MSNLNGSWTQSTTCSSCQLRHTEQEYRLLPICPLSLRIPRKAIYPQGRRKSTSSRVKLWKMRLNLKVTLSPNRRKCQLWSLPSQLSPDKQTNKRNRWSSRRKLVQLKVMQIQAATPREKRKKLTQQRQARTERSSRRRTRASSRKIYRRSNKNLERFS